MIFTLSECVKRAVELLPEDDEPMVSTGADEYALLVRRICVEKQSPEYDEAVEERHIADVVDQALQSGPRRRRRIWAQPTKLRTVIKLE